jgi:hypothetical protein
METGRCKRGDMEQPFMHLREYQGVLLGLDSEVLVADWEGNKCLGISNVV